MQEIPAFVGMITEYVTPPNVERDVLPNTSTIFTIGPTSLSPCSMLPGSRQLVVGG
ncbi:MAG: hypothetical protein R2849_21045 [Thermomicrobiales bacterium]